MAKVDHTTMKVLVFGIFLFMFANAEEKLSIKPHISEVQEGQSLKLFCELRLDSLKGLTKKSLLWKHNNERLTFGERVEEKFKDSYNVDTDINENDIYYSTLEILKVTPSNDGNYTCEFHKKVDKTYQVFNKEVTNIVVLQDIGELVLTVGTTRITGKNSGENVNIPEAGQRFVCQTKGSNPKPIIRFYLDGKNMKKEWSLADISSYVRVRSGAKSGVRSHSSELIAESRVLVKKTNKVRNLTCAAEVEGSAFKVKSVSANLSFIYDPEFTCENKSAILNDRMVKLQCDVEANPPIKKHFWRYGDILGENNTKRYEEEHVEKDGKHTFTLTIPQVLKQHFNGTFILEVITRDDKVHFHPVKLTEKSWTSTSTKHYPEFLLTAVLFLSAKILAN
ncbi:uncharacterized protein LOC115219900 [Argonauta hians]